jgi:hypothetical protein
MNIIDILLVLVGSYFLYGVLFKPSFFWDRPGMQRRREIIGDKRTSQMYLVLAIMMVAVGLIGAFGFLG